VGRGVGTGLKRKELCWEGDAILKERGRDKETI